MQEVEHRRLRQHGRRNAVALGTRAFWALWLAYFLTPLAVFPVTTHQVAFAIDRGFSRC